jgi:hypothetical protein
MQLSLLQTPREVLSLAPAVVEFARRVAFKRTWLPANQSTVKVKVVVADVFAKSLPVPVTVNV